MLAFDELTDPARRAAAFARVCAFVGLAGPPDRPDFETARNRGGRARSRLLQRVLQRRGGLRRALGRLVPSQDLRLSIGVALERANTAPGEPEEPLAGPLPAEALAAARADLAELERAHGAALGADLAAWRARIDELGGGA